MDVSRLFRKEKKYLSQNEPSETTNLLRYQKNWPQNIIGWPELHYSMDDVPYSNPKI